MTRFKWVNRWIEAEMTGFHILLAVLFGVSCIIGYLIPDRRLFLIGYIGIFLLILVHLLHMHLHACDQFLSVHLSTDQIPKAQMNRVNGVCVTLFLLFTGTAMTILPRIRMDSLLELLKRGLISFLRFLARLIPEPAAEQAGYVPPASFVPPLPEETEQTVSLLSRILDVVFTAIAAAILVVAVFFVLRRLFFALIRLLKPRNDGDEKEFLKPELFTGKTERKKRGGRPLWIDFSVNGRIRKAYRKEILGRKKAAGSGKPLPTDTPSELETRTGFVKEKERCETYHRLYEKARYSEAGCTKEELEILNRCKAQNGTGTERGD